MVLDICAFLVGKPVPNFETLTLPYISGLGALLDALKNIIDSVWRRTTFFGRTGDTRASVPQQFRGLVGAGEERAVVEKAGHRRLTSFQRDRLQKGHLRTLPQVPTRRVGIPTICSSARRRPAGYERRVITAVYGLQYYTRTYYDAVLFVFNTIPTN